jgi:hypothetical protein
MNTQKNAVLCNGIIYLAVHSKDLLMKHLKKNVAFSIPCLGRGVYCRRNVKSHSKGIVLQ